VKTKLLIFHHDASLYGASLSLLSLLEHKAFQEEYKVLVLLPYPGVMEDKLRSINIDYRIIPFPRCIAAESHSYWIRFRNILKYLKRERNISSQLQTVIKEFKPDLVYTNTSIISIGYNLSKTHNVPHIWHIREFSGFYGFQYLPFKFFVKKYINNSDLTLFSSNALKNHWIKENHPNGKVIFNGIVSGDRDHMPGSKKLQDNVWKLGLVGSVVPGKGQDVAIKAFASLVREHSNCELHFWGGTIDKPYRNRLFSIIDQNGCKSKVFFHAFEANNELIYKQLDVVLSCSTNEAFGRTIIEAMSRGIPVIANASGGPLEIIDDGINGLFYDQTPVSLFHKMEQLITNQELYATISKNAIEKAFSHFTVERYQKEILDSFNDLLNLKNDE
jgi:L-malate glycosyltransferase